MITYAFLQHYWWFLISLLGGLLAFLLFVQGGQSMLFSLPGTFIWDYIMKSCMSFSTHSDFPQLTFKA